MPESSPGLPNPEPFRSAQQRVPAAAKEEEAISSDHAITEDVVFDLVSIQYHALHGQHLYKRYLEDAPESEHPDVAEFIRECQRVDEMRANRCHELLKELTADTDTG